MVRITIGCIIYHSIRQSMYFQNMDVVKIKCDNSFSEIEFKGHQSFLTVFHTVKIYKAVFSRILF